MTTDWVLAELVSLLLNRVGLPHRTIVQIVDGIFASPNVVIVQYRYRGCGRSNGASSMGTLQAPSRQTLVDCVSFIIMERRGIRGIKEALTTDHHFEQAGFVRLLK